MEKINKFSSVDLYKDLQEINTLETSSLKDYLDFYRGEFSERCPDGIEEELGPVLQQKRNDLSLQYLKRIFCLGDVSFDMSKNLDWQAAPNGDLEWTCSLARHHHIANLAEAYRKTKKAAFAEEAVTQLLHWIDNVPVPPYPDKILRMYIGDDYLKIKRSNWRPLETGFRIGETWPTALKTLIHAECVTPEKFGKILCSIYQQASYLQKYRWQFGNHSIMEAAMLAICAILFKEFKNADQWLNETVNYLMSSRDKMFYPDGYSREMSGGYRWIMVKGYFSLYQVAFHNNMTHIFPKGFDVWLKNVAKAEIYHLKPDFSVPVTNESNSGAKRKCQLRKILDVFKDPEIEYVLTSGKKGERPCGSYFYKDARIGIMRSDWTKKGLYLSIDMGKKGGHTIGDQLSVDVSAYGRKFLVNCGRWRYTTSSNDVGWMDWAKYFKSSAACNTVCPTNFSQILADADGEMKINKNRDYADGVFDAGYTNGTTTIKIRHRRQVFFVKPFFWIIRDTLTGDVLQYPMEQVWHYHENEKVKIINTAAVTRNQDANLIIMPLSGQKVKIELFHGSENPKRGWQCPEYSAKIPAPEIVFSLKHDFPCSFETLIFPVKGVIKDIPLFQKKNDFYHVKYTGEEWITPIENRP